MELSYIQQNYSSDFDGLRNKIIGEWSERPIDDYLKQYNPKDHKINDPGLRQDKIVNVPQIVEGKETLVSKKVDRIRVPVALQKKIVRMAATFLCGKPITLVCEPKNDAEKKVFDLVQRAWEGNKLDFETKSIVRTTLSETQCAELWYAEEATEDAWRGTANDGKKVWFRVKMLSRKKGYQLYPCYSLKGDFIAFGAGYVIKTTEGTTINRFDIYTADKTYYGEQGLTGWTLKKEEKNEVKKMQIIYYDVEAPEWADVQIPIERLEDSYSNHGDTNDYNGSPILGATGTIKGFSAKGEAGKVIEMDPGAELKYISWDHSIESISAEQKNLRSLIYDLTDTPDISFEQMKSLGTYSGIALKMLFLGAHMKAAEHEENFGKGIQRRINFLKSAVTSFNTALQSGLSVVIKPKFEYFLPTDEEGIINMLSTATASKIMSQKTAVEQNPRVVDPDEEIKQLEKEGLNSEMSGDV